MYSDMSLTVRDYTPLHGFVQRHVFGNIVSEVLGQKAELIKLLRVT